jgi:Protein of unknown function (DUF2905)
MLLVLGVVIAFVGAVLYLAGDRVPLGRLPGDFSWKRKGVSIYFPLATSILISIVLTILANLFFRKR